MKVLFFSYILLILYNVSYGQMFCLSLDSRTQWDIPLSDTNWFQIVNDIDELSITLIGDSKVCSLEMTIDYSENLLIIKLTESLQSVPLLSQKVQWSTLMTSNNDIVRTINVMSYACEGYACDGDFLKKMIPWFITWNETEFEQTIMNIIRKDKSEASKISQILVFCVFFQIISLILDVCHLNPIVTTPCSTKHCFGSFAYSTDLEISMNLTCSTDEHSEVTFKILSTLELTTMKNTDEISFICNYDKCNQPGNTISLWAILRESIHNISMIPIMLYETTELTEETTSSLTIELTEETTSSLTTEEPLSSTISSTTSTTTNQTTIGSSTIPNQSEQHFHNIHIYILSLVISIYKPFI